ncbi:MAG: NIPSNAP family protein [Paludisphaera borealis]|uniref:NIPSNAP family protein n=1 Tax=Paludisphaera borealis TaxID=1387353 RepID=UPI002849F1B2|nr:NIPSNAP family protein [Paludisphaera borealis]MDR3618039.1 NIPSNAP family protein [Paludisphaera borealis]
MLRSPTAVLFLFALGLLAIAGVQGRATTDEKESHHVFELRTYYTHDGKLVDLHKRFRDHTCALLEKHGAKLIGFWTPQDEKEGKASKLIYLVSFPSREAAVKTWKEFGQDPAWQKAKAESEKNGPIVQKVESVFLDPTDYSALK